MEQGLYINAARSDEDELYVSVRVLSEGGQIGIATYAGSTEINSARQQVANFCTTSMPAIAFELGRFGPEFACGAVRLRLWKEPDGKTFTSITLEGSFSLIGGELVADTATFYAQTEPVLCDNFSDQLAVLGKAKHSQAVLYFR